MTPLFGFGFTQEDERTVATALDVAGQTVLCVASAGDIPLSLLALGARRVIAVDISEAQLHLCRLKAAAICALERDAAAGLLGFTPATAAQRRSWLGACLSLLPPRTAAFCQLHDDPICSRGAIWCARYERFIRKLRILIRPALGAAFDELTRLHEPEEQLALFDRRIARPWLRVLFRLAFSRRVYGGFGIDKRGLANRPGEVPLGEQYWAKLRSFCAATPARLNPWLQMYALGRLCSLDAAPSYLSDGRDTVRQKMDCLHWRQADLLDYVRRPLPADVSRVFLSNLPDWCGAGDFEAILRELALKLPPGSRILWSFLHADRALSADLYGLAAIGKTAVAMDRCPFYRYRSAGVEGERSSR